MLVEAYKDVDDVIDLSYMNNLRENRLKNH